MQRLIITTAAVAAWSTSVHAQELSFGVGIDAMSEYVSQGLRLSDGGALLPYAEVYYGSFYGGVYIINTEQDLTLSDYEAGVYLGYSGAVGAFSYDASWNYYVFNEPFAEFGDEFVPTDYWEVVLSGTYGLTDALFVTGRAGLAPEFDQVDLSLAVDVVTPVDGLALNTTYGSVDTDFGDWDYWSLGGSYAVSDNVSLDLTYHDSNAGPEIGTSADGLFVATLSLYFP
jgi:hypothetical protein